jgi:hypothetical protein
MPGPPSPEIFGQSSFVRAYSTHRYVILFYSLLATLAAGPLFNALGFNADLLEVFLAVNLTAAVIPSASENRRWQPWRLAAKFSVRPAAPKSSG